MGVDRTKERKRVVIVGGGHAGFRAAKRLLARRRPSDNLDVVVVSRETSEVYHGLMPQIVGGRVQARNILVPLRNFLPGMVFYNYEVERIDLSTRRVILDPAAERAKIEIPYDYLVLALGSVTDLSRFPGLHEHGLQTKTIGDVYHLHDHLLEMLERASVEDDAAERARLLTFVVAGAGYAGVEIGAEANALLRSALPVYPSIRPEELRVSIVCSSDRILPAMHEKLAARAHRHLTRKGVTILLDTTLQSASAGEVVLSTGERVPTRTIIVTIGIAPNPVIAELPLAKDRGRVKTDEFCRVPGHAGVYAIGDNAAVPHHGTGEPCPTTFLYAVTQGIRAADNILAERRERQLRPYTFRNFGEIAQLGNTFGLVQLYGTPLSGFLASILVRTAFFVAVPSWRCRLGLITDWIADAVLPTDVSQMKIARSDTIVPLRFSAGQVIVRQGEPGSRFYIVNAGRVEVVRRDGGQERVLRTLGPGEYFGEIALLQASERTATVRAVEDTRVLSIARHAFTAVVRDLPVLGKAVAEVAGSKLGCAAPASRE